MFTTSEKLTRICKSIMVRPTCWLDLKLNQTLFFDIHVHWQTAAISVKKKRRKDDVGFLRCETGARSGRIATRTLLLHAQHYFNYVF